MILYKLDSKEKMRMLEVFNDGSDLVQISGLLDGKHTEHRSPCTPKNVGKSNATTPETQAKAEADAKITEKLREGYFATEEVARMKKVMLPMLAKVFKDEKHKIDWDNTYGQPKLDGMRCHAVMKNGIIKLISRKNVEITTLNHIIQALKPFYKENLILDGELYAHGKTFQENMKLIKKYRPGKTEEVGFHIYDVATDKSFSFRFGNFRITQEHKIQQPLYLVNTAQIFSEEDFKEFHLQCVKDGYEGAMCRWGNAPYRYNGKSSNLLKYKSFFDIACKIIGVKAMDKYPDQGQFVCEVSTSSGIHSFDCGMKYSHDERREILLNAEDYIGQTAEIRFPGYTDKGLPRHAQCYGIRLDK